MKPGIANVWMCEVCGRFDFIKPEKDGILPDEKSEAWRPSKKHVCVWCNTNMSLLPDQAVITVRRRK